MQDGSQSVLSIRLEVELAKVETLSQKFGVLRAGVKDLAMQFKAGTIDANTYKAGLADIAVKGEALKGTYVQDIALTQQLANATKLASADYKTLGESLNEVVVATKKHNSISDETQQVFRGARTEARMFRFAIMEGMHAFEGLTSAMSAFSDGSEESKKQVKEFAATIQSAGMAGLGMKFMLEAMGPTMAEFAGPVAIAVAAITLLSAAFKDVNETAKKAADEGLSDFDKYLATLGSGGREGVAKELSNRLKEAKEELAGLEIEKQLQEQRLGLSMPDSPRAKVLREEIKQYGDYNKKVEDAIALAKAKLEVDSRLKSLYGVAPGIPEGGLPSIKDPELDDASTKLSKQLSLARDKYEIQKLSLGAYQSELSALLKTAKTEEDRVAIQKVQFELAKKLSELGDKANKITKQSGLGEAVKIEDVKDLASAQRSGKLIMFTDGTIVAATDIVDGSKLKYKYEGNKLDLAMKPKAAVVHAEDKSKETHRTQQLAIADWKRENEASATAMRVAGAGLDSLVSGLMVTRQGINALDSAWIAMENAAISAIEAVAEKLLETGIISLLASIASGGTLSLADAWKKYTPFADGGWIPEPVMGVGKSGQVYTFAERGPEYVHSNASMQSMMKERYSGGGGDRQIINALNNLQLKLDVSTTKLSVGLQGGNRIRAPRLY